MTTVVVVTRCMVCGRKLTDPISVKRGIGPVCLKRLKRIQKMDLYFSAVSPDKSGYAVDENVSDIGFKWAPLPTCPSCGKASPNPNYCPSCGSPMKAKPLEVVA
ncbi:MAG: DUF6011 domain-containing protein [Candidatus Bathyarchaeota archaeon]